MLMSKFSGNNFRNNKKKKIFSNKFFKKSLLFILPVFVINSYIISKSNDIVNWSKFDFFNKLLINNGFMIKNVEVLGNKYLNKNDIINIVTSSTNDNIFNVNIKRIHEKIRKITWVKDASIKVIYPDTIRILLNEKIPIAIWQNKYGNQLVTKNGEIILEKNLNYFKNNLPIIIGNNAHKNINTILEILNINKSFAKNIWSLTFVNERRWDIHFNQGLTIRLPSINVKEAWQKISFLNENFNILKLGLIEIDLRNPNQFLAKINIDKKLIFRKKVK